MGQFNTRLPDELLQHLKKRSDSTGVPQSKIVRKALEIYLVGGLDAWEADADEHTERATSRIRALAEEAVREETRKPPPPPASSSEPQQLPQGVSSPPVTSGSQESTPPVGQKTALQVANQHGVPLAIAQRMIREGRA